MDTEFWHRGRTAIVTGGAAGIGLATAEVLTRRGARVAIGARRLGDPEQATRIAGLLPDAFVGALDVRDAASVGSFVEAVRDVFGPPDILVNAAGISTHQRVSEHDDRDWDGVIDTNLSGCYRTIRACLPGMLERGWGRIVNIGSTAARVAEPTHGAYCASKAGLLGLTRAVALEGAPRGVACLAISPTWVETEMLRQSAATMATRSGRSVADEIAEMARSNPQHRLVQPSEVAEMVSFACSDLAPGLTMEDIQINAGAQW